jgi:hypothetical protein
VAAAGRIVVDSGGKHEFIRTGLQR